MWLYRNVVLAGWLTHRERRLRMGTLSTHSWLVRTLVVIDAFLILLSLGAMIAHYQGIALWLIGGATILVIATGALRHRD